MSSLGVLSDQDLLDVFEKANKYQLEKLFIDTLKDEMDRRGLKVKEETEEVEVVEKVEELAVF